jgi:TrmH family RNA methyltransferase
MDADRPADDSLTADRGVPRRGAAEALANIRIVLVEPQHPGNIGAVARAMKNMALSRLVLVKPADHLAPEARMMAMHALDILQQARLATTLAEAVADAGCVVGTTRRLGKARQAHFTPRAIAPMLLELAAANPVAVVFGREDSGLTNAELQQCHELVTIPAHPVFGSLNLAQAVLLVSYELYLATMAEPRASPPKLATVAELERLYSRMQRVLQRVGFLHGSNPARMMGYFRRFFARQGLRSRDVKIFLGVFRQIEWYLDQFTATPPAAPERCQDRSTRCGAPPHTTGR